MQQKSQLPPPGNGQSKQPVFGPTGFSTKLVELLLLEVGRTALTGLMMAEGAIAKDGKMSSREGLLNAAVMVDVSC